MSGEQNLHKIIKNLHPQLHEGQYVFVTVASMPAIAMEECLSIFREEKGITLIMKREKANELGLEYSFIASWITLRVHSSLEAVGLTARVSTALAEAGISCNAVAAFYHDHIFVPYRQADRALVILRNL